MEISRIRITLGFSFVVLGYIFMNLCLQKSSWPIDFVSIKRDLCEVQPMEVEWLSLGCFHLEGLNFMV